MKKLISLILCIVIAASVSLSAFAKTDAVVPDTAYTATLNRGAFAEYSFTAPETAVYQITVKNLNNSWASLILTYEDEENYGISVDFYYDSASVREDYFTTGKGSNYTITVSNTVDMLDGSEQKELGVPDTAKVEFTVRKVTFPEVELGGTYSVKGTVTDSFMAAEYYCMMPRESGYYNFRSQADGLTAPQLEIVSDKCYSNFGGGYDSPFDTTVYMEKGHLYLVDISAIAFGYLDKDYDRNKAEPYETEFTFSVNDGNNIKIESVSAYEEKITLAKNWYAFGYCFISPSSFTPDFDVDEITVTSSNPRVAGTSEHYLFQDCFQFEIDSFHYGKTTITVTFPNGMSTDIKVYVKPRIIIFFENLIARLLGR